MTDPLYDTPADVLRKAMRATGCAASELAEASGVERSAIEALLRDRFDPEVARAVATPLGLDPDAFALRDRPYPQAPLPAQVERLVLPFDDEHVNAWLFTDGRTPLVIDAGSGPRDLLGELEQRAISRVDLLITHTHPDHVGGLDSLRPLVRHLLLPGDLDGDTVEVGDRSIGILDLGGHHPTAVGYRFDDRRLPVVAVGDAVFAGSIGGCAGPAVFQQARRTIADNLLPLPDGTFLLPGHGPATTLGTELERNPFLAAWR